MKKLRIFFIIVFIFSITMIGFQLRDKVKSQMVNNELSEIYYKEDMDKNKDNISTIDKKDAADKKNGRAKINDNYSKDILAHNPLEEDSIRDEEINSKENLVNVKAEDIVANSKKAIILDEFKALIEKNENTVGWLKIQNTNIDYPVVQGEDNDFYLNHDFYGRKNAQGSIFMDFRSRGDLQDKHTIIYGHHMKNRTMFNDLNFYKDEDFFKANKTFTMKSLYKEETYEIFSTHIYENDPYIIKTRFNNHEFTSFIDSIKEKAEHKTDIDIKEDDNILTLITCAYDFKDARYVVHARKVE